MDQLAALSTSPLFKGVPLAALQEAALITTERHYRAGDTILQQDAEGEALHLIITGVVRVWRVNMGSRERVMGDLYAPGVMGETAVLGGGERSATVRAMTDVTTLMLHRAHFRQILQRHPDVLWNLSALLVQRITVLNDELIAFGMTTAAALSHVLSHVYEQRVRAGVPQPHVLPMGTNDIVQRIGASRETVSRVMRSLSSSGVLTFTAQDVTLLDPEGLRRLSLEETATSD